MDSFGVNYTFEKKLKIYENFESLPFVIKILKKREGK
jgi:hypothetical protein